MENRLSPESVFEKFGTGMDSLRRLTASAWQIGILMTKGAYLVGERRRLFVKLGEEVFDRHKKGELKLTDNPALEPLLSIVHQLERLSKKVELEEMLIRNLRFNDGKRRGAPDKTT